MNDSMFRKTCLCCGSDDLKEIIDLGMHPMADTFISMNDLDKGDRAYALICDLCPRCHQIQLRTITDPDERYVLVDYSYTSSNSSTSRAHWTEYARAVSSRYSVPTGSTVVEIGSNDGYLLEQFKGLGFRSQGVDPSPVMAALARDRGVPTEVDFFSLACSDKLNRLLPEKPMLIAANNVFNHSNEPLDFALGIKNLLAREGVFVFELPYWLCSMEQGKFDQIYHEHVTYFTVSYAINLFSKVGMHVVAVEEVDYHGGSIRVYVRHQADSSENQDIAAFLAREMAAKLFDVDTYVKFSNDIRQRRNKFLSNVYSLKVAGAPIACVGAAAKGNTFLNFYNLDGSVIDFVTDSSESKIGKHTPLTRIPILDDTVLASYPLIYLIILSWNLEKALRPKLLQINPNVQLLNPYQS